MIFGTDKRTLINFSNFKMFVHAIIPSCVLLAAILTLNSDYLVDHAQILNPDAKHYWLMGENIFRHGAFSRSASPPYIPDPLRTPIYPMFVGFVRLFFDVPATVYMAQVVIFCCCVVIMFQMLNLLWDKSVVMPVITCFIMIMNITFIGSNFTVMSETLHNLFMLLSFYFFVLILKNGEFRMRDWFLSFSMLGLATLTRPAAQFVVFFYAILLFFALANINLQKSIKFILFGIMSYILVLSPWLIRNQLHFGVPKLCFIGSNSLTYFIGAGIYQLKYRIEMKEAWAQISKDYEIKTYAEVANLHGSPVSKREYKDIYRRLDKVGMDIIKNNKRLFLISSFMAIFKSHISHMTELIAAQLNMEWHGLNKDAILHKRYLDLFRTSKGDNAVILIMLFIYQMAYMIFCAMLFMLGIKYIMYNRKIKLALKLAVLGLPAYYCLMIAMAGVDAYWRFRIPAGLLQVFMKLTSLITIG